MFILLSYYEANGLELITLLQFVHLQSLSILHINFFTLINFRTGRFISPNITYIACEE